MRYFVALTVLACGGPPAPTFAPVTVHVPTGYRLSTGSVIAVDGGTAGALEDGGAFWFAHDGDSQNVLIGADFTWLLQHENSNATGVADCQASHFVPDAGFTLTVAFDGGDCSQLYE